MSNTFDTVNPATGEVIETYTRMTDEQADHVVERCHDAFTTWRHKSHSDRSAVIAEIGTGLRARKEELAQLMTRDG